MTRTNEDERWLFLGSPRFWGVCLVLGVLLEALRLWGWWLVHASLPNT